MGFLAFIETKDTGKTKVFDVISSNVTLGEVRWYGPWRRYTFHPSEGTLFDRNCMNEIIVFIDQLMDDRKAKRANNTNPVIKKPIKNYTDTFSLMHDYAKKIGYSNLSFAMAAVGKETFVKQFEESLCKS